MHIGNFYFLFTNPSLFMLLTLSSVLLLLHFVTKMEEKTRYKCLAILDRWSFRKCERKVFPSHLSHFDFLLFRNPQGMIPYSFTLTSHFLITLGLSFSLFIAITIVGFQRNWLHFFSFLLPARVSLPLAPFLILLELIPYCFRALSS
ncbi:hypothetical protein IC575_006689 [Cucumis melo]